MILQIVYTITNVNYWLQILSKWCQFYWFYSTNILIWDLKKRKNHGLMENHVVSPALLSKCESLVSRSRTLSTFMRIMSTTYGFESKLILFKLKKRKKQNSSKVKNNNLNIYSKSIINNYIYIYFRNLTYNLNYSCIT